MTATPAIAVDALVQRYGDRTALGGISFAVAPGELFGLLGPNGGGKSTLFRILATLQRPTGGAARIEGHDVVADPAGVRRRIGIVFQHPSVDGKLTVEENLRHHGRLHGLRGADLRERIERQLGRFGLGDRRRDLVEKLSGGLARRVELAKGLLPQPSVLLLDEPSTGLDPGARRDLLGHLAEVRAQEGTTVLLTTHHMDEAERCDRVAVLDRGRLVALDAPGTLKAAVGGDVVVIQGRDPARLQARLRERLRLETRLVDGTLRLEHPRGHELVREVVEALGDDVHSVSVGRPTLEDVFVRLTGRTFFDAGAEAPEGAR
ncbi:MAG: ATP-binding cassette domain-containing protein [bacterium]|nr:ATP-binding cassette domain-containing protein [bacterium]